MCDLNRFTMLYFSYPLTYERVSRYELNFPNSSFLLGSILSNENDISAIASYQIKTWINRDLKY